MCNVVAYNDVFLEMILSLTWSNNKQFYYHFYVDTESKTPYLLTSTTESKTLYPLTSITYLIATVSSSSSGSIVTPTATVTQGKWSLEI